MQIPRWPKPAPNRMWEGDRNKATQKAGQRVSESLIEQSSSGLPLSETAEAGGEESVAESPSETPARKPHGSEIEPSKTGKSRRAGLAL